MRFTWIGSILSLGARALFRGCTNSSMSYVQEVSNTIEKQIVGSGKTTEFKSSEQPSPDIHDAICG